MWPLPSVVAVRPRVPDESCTASLTPVSIQLPYAPFDRCLGESQRSQSAVRDEDGEIHDVGCVLTRRVNLRPDLKTIPTRPATKPSQARLRYALQRSPHPFSDFRFFGRFWRPWGRVSITRPNLHPYVNLRTALWIACVSSSVSESVGRREMRTSL
jgi:hypothetical protein